MAEQPKFPFRLKNAFFIASHFERAPQSSESITIPFTAEIKVEDRDYPNFQVNLRIENESDLQPIRIHVEVIGLFSLVENQPIPDKSLLGDFINQQALFVLWAYVKHYIQSTTSQMGIMPIDIPMPYFFDAHLPEMPTVPSAVE